MLSAYRLESSRELLNCSARNNLIINVSLSVTLESYFDSFYR